ncbi:hypothetical protein KQP68_04220 [Bacteroides thetaiotaomicron]|uniref:Lipoprotein n=1 Tax=Bacteroides thetaiotaomicron TaxID=818 RepID=A0ABD7U5N2_BACT4|nr:hypothetical protein [Bacteroides thetaiotaomicron]UYU67496.1 hypothetical protein KQP68_04220 [Bacteroides thetaiotaomicron]
MKPNLFMKRKLEIGLTLLIGMSAFWGCNNDLAPIRQNQALPPDLSKHSVFESFSPDSGGIGHTVNHPWKKFRFRSKLCEGHCK